MTSSFFSINSRFGLVWFGWDQVTHLYRKIPFHYYFTPSDFFTPALADGLSLKSGWHDVSRTLLSILDNLSNTVVWMVSILPLTSNPTSSWGPLKARQLPMVLSWLSCSTVFLILCQGSSICRSFSFLLFSRYGLPERLKSLDSKFFIIYLHEVWSTGRD